MFSKEWNQSYPQNTPDRRWNWSLSVTIIYIYNLLLFYFKKSSSFCHLLFVVINKVLKYISNNKIQHKIVEFFMTRVQCKCVVVIF